MQFLTILASPKGETTKVYFAFEKDKGFANALGKEGDILRSRLEEEGFLGKESTAGVSHLLEKGEPARSIALGLGSKTGFGLESLRRAGGRLARKAREIRVEVITAEWPRAFTDEHLFAFAEGVLLGSYQFTRYKSPSKDASPGLQKVYFKISKERKSNADKVLSKAQAFGEGTILARDLINGAPSDVTPKVLADTARKIAKGKIKLKVFGKRELIKMGAGGLLGVNRGSAQDPYLIHLHYKPTGKAKKVLALVGKGITFDSGGLSLKPASGMETMKMDMSGAAAVLGVFSQLNKTQPRVEVHGIIPTTENMPGGRAYKPGDVLKALNGKTMEVLNTDAEGRLILSDGLSYADRLKVDGIIDLATLTGACVVALGSLVAGALTNDQALLNRLKAATEAEGEPIWELPLVKEYRDDIKSKVADIKNIGSGREAGTITAAMFLQEFVGETPWVHLDIAGPAYLEREFPSVPYLAHGGTGLMVRSLLNFLKNE